MTPHTRIFFFFEWKTTKKSRLQPIQSVEKQHKYNVPIDAQFRALKCKQLNTSNSGQKILKISITMRVTSSTSLTNFSNYTSQKDLDRYSVRSFVTLTRLQYHGISILKWSQGLLSQTTSTFSVSCRSCHLDNCMLSG